MLKVIFIKADAANDESSYLIEPYADVFSWLKKKRKKKAIDFSGPAFFH